MCLHQSQILALNVEVFVTFVARVDHTNAVDILEVVQGNLRLIDNPQVFDIAVAMDVQMMVVELPVDFLKFHFEWIF